MSYSGANWLEKSLKKKCSPLGRAVADLLGDVFLGLYHLPQNSLERVDWTDDLCIDLIYGYPLCTVDGNELTRLVVLAHDRMIRVSVEGVGPRYMRLTFHQRKTREGEDFCERCPTLEEHVRLLRDHYQLQGCPDPL